MNVLINPVGCGVLRALPLGCCDAIMPRQERKVHLRPILPCGPPLGAPLLPTQGQVSEPPSRDLQIKGCPVQYVIKRTVCPDTSSFPGKRSGCTCHIWQYTATFTSAAVGELLLCTGENQIVSSRVVSHLQHYAVRRRRPSWHWQTFAALYISWTSPVHAFPIAHDHFSNIIDIADMPWQRHPRYFLFMALIVMATIYFLIPSQSPIQSNSFAALVRDTGLPARLERAEQVYQKVISDRKDMIRKYGPTPRHIHMCVCPSGFL